MKSAGQLAVFLKQLIHCVLRVGGNINFAGYLLGIDAVSYTHLLSHLEREIIANVVRYNIRDFDYDKVQLETQVHQEEDIGMSRNAITILIAKLTAILRLANSMDRSRCV